jgi:hypothetical protein
MKKYAIIALFLASSAFASECPTLSGNYNGCVANSPDSGLDLVTVAITQSVNANGVDVYRVVSTDKNGGVSDQTTAADGKEVVTDEVDPAMGNVRTVEKYSCSEQKLIGRVATTSDKMPDMNMDVRMEMSKTAEGNLLMNLYQGDGAEVGLTMTCYGGK